MFELLAVLGIAISAAAYVPQIVHIEREHCSAGVSSRAWMMWLVSSVLIGTLAVHRHDAVFILLQISSLLSAAVILFLSRRYCGLVCDAHMQSIPKRWIGSDTIDRFDDFRRSGASADGLGVVAVNPRQSGPAEGGSLSHGQADTIGPKRGTP